MTQLLHFPATPQPPTSAPVAGSEGGEGAGCQVGGTTPALLEYEWIEDPRWCNECGGRQTFVTVEEIAGGWHRGYCLGCEQEKLVLFSRAVSEAA